MRACRVWLGSVARQESRAKKTAVKKRLSPLLTRFAGDGCLEMSKNSAERAIRPIALGGKNYFLLVPTPEDGVRRSSSPSSRPPNSTMSKESLAVPLRARRSKTIMAAGSLFRFARQVPRTRKRCGRVPRAQANLRRRRITRRNWREPHEFRSGLSGVRQTIGGPAKPAGAQQSARSICCSSRPLPRSRLFARWDANSPRW